MRGSTTLVRVVPRGEYMLTLKTQGKLVDGSLEELREELYLARRNGGRKPVLKKLSARLD